LCGRNDSDHGDFVTADAGATGHMDAKSLPSDQTYVSGEDAIGLKGFVAFTTAETAKGVDDNRAVFVSKRNRS
jgi:hypothetical protein